MEDTLKIVFIGLSITSSWGNGHATTYRALVRELDAQGHAVLFLERDKPWYRANRDLPQPPWGQTELYDSLEELKGRFGEEVRTADAVIVGSYVPNGIEVGDWVLDQAKGARTFYDIDTPVTLSRISAGGCQYLEARQISRYDLYLSFTGGPALKQLEDDYRSPRARPLYCSVDPAAYYPEPLPMQWDLGYLGTYAADRQPVVEELVNHPARQWPQGRFVVAGPMYPEEIRWPGNVMRIDHAPPSEHRRFYNAQRFTLNATRADMVRLGYSPSVRLFEAAACATPVIGDYWEGLESFFAIGSEILVARSAADCLDYLREMPEEERLAIGQRARSRILAEHTAAHRAAELVRRLRETRAKRGRAAVPNA